MTQKKLELIANMAFEIMRSHAPINKQKNTNRGNLRYLSIRMERVNDEAYEIYVSVDIAPYVYYTNEKWISPKWRGKKNPNEGWVEAAIDEILQMIAKETGGEIADV